MNMLFVDFFFFFRHEQPQAEGNQLKKLCDNTKHSSLASTVRVVTGGANVGQVISLNAKNHN